MVITAEHPLLGALQPFLTADAEQRRERQTGLLALRCCTTELRLQRIAVV